MRFFTRLHPEYFIAGSSPHIIRPLSNYLPSIAPEFHFLIHFSHDDPFRSGLGLYQR